MCFIYILIRFVVVVVAVVFRVSINVDWVPTSECVESMNDVGSLFGPWKSWPSAMPVDMSQQFGWTAEDEK